MLVAAGAKLAKDAQKQPLSLLSAVELGKPYLVTYALAALARKPSSFSFLEDKKHRLDIASDSGLYPCGLAARNGSCQILEISKHSRI